MYPGQLVESLVPVDAITGSEAYPTNLGIFFSRSLQLHNPFLSYAEFSHLLVR